MYSGPRPARAMPTPPLRLPMRRSLLLLPALAALALPARAADGWLLGTDPQRAVYVDSLAAPGGDGASPATAFRTLREGIADAGAHCTVWVRGGPDRAYDVTNAAEALSIPASKEGLAIRSFGGEGPADPFHPDFARPRSRRDPGDIGRLGWRGENGEHPLWIGALPPLYPEATLLILR